MVHKKRIIGMVLINDLKIRQIVSKHILDLQTFNRIGSVLDDIKIFFKSKIKINLFRILDFKIMVDPKSDNSNQFHVDLFYKRYKS